jgi:group I intron endonuclease
MRYTIYKITNIVNGKIYIGQTKQSLSDRLCKHFYDSRAGDYYFANALKKYGKENFKMEKIDEAETVEECNEKEIYYIDKLKSRNREIGYNSRVGGDNNEKSFEEIAKHCETKKRDYKFLGVGKSKRGIYYKIAFKRTLDLEEIRGGFKTYECAAMARDMRILELFELDVAYPMLNIPELIGCYLNNEIKIDRIVKGRKRKEYEGVEKSYSKFCFSICRKGKYLKFSGFETEEQAAEARDFFKIQELKEMEKLNFPNKIEDYQSSSYQPPLPKMRKVKGNFIEWFDSLNG